MWEGYDRYLKESIIIVHKISLWGSNPSMKLSKEGRSLTNMVPPGAGLETPDD